MSNLWVYAENDTNGLTDLSLQCMAKGRELADAGCSGAAAGCKLGVLVVGADVASLAPELIGRGADTVYVAEDARLTSYTTAPYRKVVSDAIVKHHPSVILLPASTQGSDVACAVAARLSAGCITDCCSIALDGNRLVAKRVEYDGKVLTTYVSEPSPLQLCTLRDGIAEAASPEASRSGEVVALDVELGDAEVATAVLRREVARRTVNLKDAKIIVTGGAGVGTKEKFALIQDLADVLGAEVGATRPVVDAGWTAHERQVGQTGATVKPDLYIACGVSGAVQHRVGMRDSSKVIAINTDPAAPIFRFSHYRIIGDLTTVIPKLVKLLQA